MRHGPLAVVEAWLDAVNRSDGHGIEQLSHDQVEITGPRGSGPAPRRALSEWLARSGFSATARRWYCGADGQVVVEQDARWTDRVSDTEQSRAVVVSRFLIEAGRVSRYARHDDLDDALRAAGLGPDAQVTARR